MKVSWNQALKILALPYNGTFKTLVREQNTVMQVYEDLKKWKSKQFGLFILK